MVKRSRQDIEKTLTKQGPAPIAPEPYKIGASTPYDFEGKNLTAYGGLLPIATLLEKLQFRQLVEETLSVKRLTRAMSLYQFVLAMVLSLYVGFSRLYHLRFLKREPMLVGILQVSALPPQSTFWRFLASLHLNVGGQLLKVQRVMRQRVWEAAHVKLRQVTLDTDTTVHTLFGDQMGGRKSYNPKNKGKKSYQPILTFLAETREYVGGELRNGDRPTGAQMAAPGERVRLLAGDRGDDLCASRLGVLLLGGGPGICSPGMPIHRLGAQDLASGGCIKSGSLDRVTAHRRRRPVRVFLPAGGVGQGVSVHRLRYQKKQKTDAGEPEQYQLFDTPEYSYRVFVTNLDGPIDALVWFYNQRAGAENLIKEANNDAGLAAHPSARWAMNCIHFQLAMLAYNLNCWLMLFNREPEAKVETLQHTRLATSRLRFLFLAAKIWRHAGRVGSQLQRSLRGEGPLGALDASVAGDWYQRQRIPAGDCHRAALLSFSRA